MELLKRIEGDGRENLLIKGDNFEVMKELLNKGYEGKIDLIITDPPYNNKVSKRGGVREGGTQYSYSDGRLDWDVFIRERFLLVKELMASDGVLFVNIGEKELGRLIVILDEIFGVNNRLPILYWKKGGGANISTTVKKTIEPILCYKKASSKIVFNKVKNKGYEKNNGLKSCIKGDDGVYYSWRRCSVPPNLYERRFDYEVELDGVKYYPEGDEESYRKRLDMEDKDVVKSGLAKGFRLIKKTVIERYDRGDIETRVVDGRNELYYKEYSREDTTANSYVDLDGGGNRASYNEIKRILHDTHFTYAKPLKLIKYLIYLSGKEDGIVLDLFNGSGTTSCAVLEDNKERGVSNSFIGIQLDEDGIPDRVTYPRIQRTIEGYVDNKGRDVEGVGGNVSYYKLDSCE